MEGISGLSEPGSARGRVVEHNGHNDHAAPPPPGAANPMDLITDSDPVQQVVLSDTHTRAAAATGEEERGGSGGKGARKGDSLLPPAVATDETPWSPMLLTPSSVLTGSWAALPFLFVLKALLVEAVATDATPEIGGILIELTLAAGGKTMVLLNTGSGRVEGRRIGSHKRRPKRGRSGLW